MATFTITFKEMAQSQGCVIGTDEYDPKWYGMDTYPIFDESHRSDLNRKIIDHFWNREIGQESVSMFHHAMRRKLNEIMPYYNEQYRMSAIVIDPTQTIDMETKGTSTGTETGKATGTNSSDSTASARTVLSDHPQELLAGDGDYATNSNDNISNSSASGNSESDTSNTSSADTDSTTKGSMGHTATLVWQARQAIVNVDMLVIAELEHLFMKVWASTDEMGDYNNFGGYYGYFW